MAQYTSMYWLLTVQLNTAHVFSAVTNHEYTFLVILQSLLSFSGFDSNHRPIFYKWTQHVFSVQLQSWNSHFSNFVYLPLTESVNFHTIGLVHSTHVLMIVIEYLDLTLLCNGGCTIVESLLQCRYSTTLPTLSGIKNARYELGSRVPFSPLSCGRTWFSPQCLPPGNSNTRPPWSGTSPLEQSLVSDLHVSPGLHSLTPQTISL
jgi:hypothetical protein